MTPKTKNILFIVLLILFTTVAVVVLNTMPDHKDRPVAAKTPAQATPVKAPAPPVPAWKKYRIPPPKSWNATATLYPIFHQLSWMSYRKDHYLALARAGDPEAMILLVHTEFDYNDVTYTTKPAKPETADYWLQEAVRITKEPGWVYLALAYLRAFKGGSRSGFTGARMFETFRRAADTGYPPAVIAYAEYALKWRIHYEEEVDVTNDPQAEARHVAKLLHEYIEKYDDTHARMLLLRFLLPRKHIEVSDEEIQTRLKQSATEGHEWAIRVLALYYLEGRAGFPKDIDESMKWHFISDNIYLQEYSRNGHYEWEKDFPPERVQKAKDAAAAWKAAHPNFVYIPERHGIYPDLWTKEEIEKGQEHLQAIYARMRQPLMKQAGSNKDKE